MLIDLSLLEGLNTSQNFQIDDSNSLAHQAMRRLADLGLEAALPNTNIRNEPYITILHHRSEASHDSRERKNLIIAVKMHSAELSCPMSPWPTKFDRCPTGGRPATKIWKATTQLDTGFKPSRLVAQLRHRKLPLAALA